MLLIEDANSKTSVSEAAAKQLTALTNITSVAFLGSFYGLHAPVIPSPVLGLDRAVLFLLVPKTWHCTARCC